REPGYLRVLLRDAVARVQHDDADIRPLYGELGAHDGELFYPVVHLRLAADARRVDEDVFAVFIFKGRVHSVPRRTGDIGDDDALLAQDEVYEGALAHVGLADDGDLYPVVLLVPFLLGREMRHALVQQVAQIGRAS